MKIPHFRLIPVEEWENYYRKCHDCGKSYKVKNLVCNIDTHYHCKKCAEKYDAPNKKAG
jgi:tRNA(Ile2) C34 agmatinyltransferase TiaS